MLIVFQNTDFIKTENTFNLHANKIVQHISNFNVCRKWYESYVPIETPKRKNFSF